jgi:molybdopterin converting factor small subunit
LTGLPKITKLSFLSRLSDAFMIKVNIHSSLARFTNNQTQLELPIDNTTTILSVLCQHYEKLRTSILDEKGELTPYVNIYVNGANLNQLTPSPLNHNDTVDLVTALVGG